MCRKRFITSLGHVMPSLAFLKLLYVCFFPTGSSWRWSREHCQPLHDTVTWEKPFPPCTTDDPSSCSSCQTHHVIPQSCSHVSVSPLAEVETVLREVGGVRDAVLKKENTHQCLCTGSLTVQLTFVLASRVHRGSYSSQRYNGVPEKWLHNNSKVLSAVVAASVHQIFSFILMERRQRLTETTSISP